MKKIIAIVGPTASGKTSLGVLIAKKYNGEIVSADSRQVYKGLDIGTGKEGRPQVGNDKFLISNGKLNSNVKTTKTECHSEFISESREIPKQIRDDKEIVEELSKHIRFADTVPQWLIDICEPGEKFTMFDWLDRVKVVINDIFERGKVPIIVGGTGLYVQALVEGFQLMPEKSKIQNPNDKSIPKKQIPKYKREELEKMPLSELQSVAKKLMPQAYILDMNNTRRLIRFIERAASHERMTKKKPDFEALQIALDIPREKLYQKIDDRVDEWFRQGFEEEVMGLLKSGVDPKWLISLGLEYRVITKYILENPKSKIQNQNEIQNPKSKNPEAESRKLFSDMKQEMKYRIHQYARRQLTWFRRFPEIVWAKNKKEIFDRVDGFLK